MQLEKVRVVQVMPVVTGQGRNGEWRKQEIIVETTNSQYPKKVCISVWGDKINPSLMQEGNVLNIDFDVESREYNSRWYTDIKAWKMEMAQGGGAPQGGYSQESYNNGGNYNPPPQQQPPAEVISNAQIDSSSMPEDLPF
jgi:hypothetical protein